MRTDTLSKKWLLLLSAGVLLALSFGGYVLWYAFSIPAGENAATLSDPTKTVHTVTLTKEGWVPQELTIRLGEKVVFNNADNTPYWPASSLHPDHKIYPAFDAKERIVPPENWEFVFDQVGRWKYHDHINSHQSGVITVIDPSLALEAQTSAKLTECIDLDVSLKQQCWDKQLEEVLQTQGLQKAFAFFVELYKTEPDVPKACHEWGHSLGKASYREYKKSGTLMLEPEAAYCGYGYFHSFIAELVKDTGDFEKVIDFCTQVVEELGAELGNVANNCVHGVGHGTTAWLLENPENWGQFQKTADEGTQICERIYQDEEDLQNCYDGVFNELHLDLFNDQYGLSFADFMARNDPFWICNEQKEAHKRACYFEFVGIFWKIFEMDFHAAIQYVVANTQEIEERGPYVVSKIAADWIQFDIVNPSFERNIEGCRSVPDFLFEACIQGLANGFIQHGEPNNLHEKAFSFCSASYLTEDERTLCFKHFLQMLFFHYNTEQFVDACLLVDQKFRTPQCADLIIQSGKVDSFTLW